MNIFFLDKNPQKAAEYLCDKHVPKMLLESSQMLSTAVQRHLGTIEDLYKPAYPKHPMTIWVGHTRQNFIWALENAVFISQEYYKRFNKKLSLNGSIYYQRTTDVIDFPNFGTGDFFDFDENIIINENDPEFANYNIEDEK